MREVSRAVVPSHPIMLMGGTTRNARMGPIPDFPRIQSRIAMEGARFSRQVSCPSPPPGDDPRLRREAPWKRS